MRTQSIKQTPSWRQKGGKKTTNACMSHFKSQEELKYLGGLGGMQIKKELCCVSS